MVIVALSKGLHFASHLGHTLMCTALTGVARGVRTQAKRSSGTDLSMQDSGYQAGSGEHHPCAGDSDDDSGQNVEREVDAEIDAGEDDDDPGQHQRGSER